MANKDGNTFCSAIGLLLCLVFFSMAASGQQAYRVRGRIVDSTGRPVASATLLLRSAAGDSLHAFSDSAGRFTFTGCHSNRFDLAVSSVGYAQWQSHYTLPAGAIMFDVGAIVLQYHFEHMQAVILTAPVAAVTIKEDTIDYKADSFNVDKDADVEDLLKKLPGILVKRDGNIIAQGKAVTKIKVNGKDFFDGDIQTATKNIPAAIVDKVQVINDYGEASNFTGIKGTEPEKIINIQLKKDKERGYFAKLTDGGGTGNIYQSDNAVNYFDNDRQASVFANNNNNGAPSLVSGVSKPFFGDLSSLMQLNNNVVQELGGSKGIASLLANQDFGYFSLIPGYANGVNRNAIYGARYSDDAGKKFRLYASYINYNIDNQLQSTMQGLEFADAYHSIDQKAASGKETFSKGRRLFTNFEYIPDSFFSVKLTPNLSRRNTVSNETVMDTNSYKGTPLNYAYMQNRVTNENDQLSLDLLIKKRFRHSRPKWLIGLNYSGNRIRNNIHNYNVFTSYGIDTSDQQQPTTVRTDNYHGSLSYIFPILGRQVAEAYINYDLSNSTMNRDTYWFLPETDSFARITRFSGVIHSLAHSQVAGINNRLVYGKMEYTVGLGLQRLSYTRNETFDTAYVRATNINFLPLLQISRKLSANALLNFKYSGAVRQPNPFLLIPIPDSTNSLAIYKGNVRLKPEFANTINLYYYKFDLSSGKLILVGAMYSKVFDKIMPTVEVDGAGRTMVSYINSKYGNDMGIYYNLSKPFDNRRYEVSVGGNIINSGYAFYSNGWNVIHSWKMTHNLEVKLNENFGDISVGMSVNGHNFLYKNNNRDVFDYSLNQRSNMEWGGFRVGYSLSFVRPHGYLIPGGEQDMLMLDGYCQQKITHRLFFRLEGNDLFNQSRRNANRLNSDNYLSDYRFNTVGRYLLFLVIFKLNHFTGAG